MKTFAELEAGDRVGPIDITVSPEANARYWQSAGVDHPSLARGALYPLIAANCTVLAFGAACPDAMIQTRQHLVCHRRADAPATLHAEGVITERWERRGLPYLAVQVEVTTGDAPLWTSTVHFTPASEVGGRR